MFRKEEAAGQLFVTSVVGFGFYAALVALLSLPII